MLAIQSEKQTAGFFPPFIHALEVSLTAIPGRQSLHQCLILSVAWQRMEGVYGDLMAALEQMLSHLPAKGASNSCQAHGPSD